MDDLKILSCNESFLFENDSFPLNYQVANDLIENHESPVIAILAPQWGTWLGFTMAIVVGSVVGYQRGGWERL